MKSKYIQIILITFMFSCSSIYPEETGIKELFKAAAEKDTTLKILKSEQRVDFLNEKIEDYTEDFNFGFGTGGNGINFFKSEDTNGKTYFIYAIRNFCFTCTFVYGFPGCFYFPYEMYQNSREITTFEVSDITGSSFLFR